MRTFIAIEIEESIRAELAQAQAGLRPVEGIKWVEPQNFHLTLRFLGEVDQGTVSRLVNEIGIIAAATAHFILGFAGAGAFPNERRPRVVWIGLDRGLEPLFALAQRVEAACQALGFAAEERPFSAHLTLGRAKGVISALTLQASLEALSGRHFGEQEINHITIMESTLTRSGPIYRPVTKLALKGSGAGET